MFNIHYVSVAMAMVYTPDLGYVKLDFFKVYLKVSLIALKQIPPLKNVRFWLWFWFLTIDIEYNKRLDRQRPCLEDELNGGSNNIVQSNKSVGRWW